MQVVPYGQVVARGSKACLSEYKGMTCWDTRTHHGFFLERASWASW